MRPFLALPLLLATPAWAQSDVEVRGELRARGETVDGQPRADGPTGESALMLRTLIAVEWKTGPLRIGGEIADSRSYGDGADSVIGTGEVNALEPLQAYVGAQLAEGASVQAGRFTLDLGSRRLVARNGFRNTINGFTGVRLDLGDPKAQAATLFWTMPQQRLPADAEGLRRNRVEIDRERATQQLFGGFATAALPLGRAEAYLYRLHERDGEETQTRNRRLWTLGGRLTRAPRAGRVDWDVEAVWQGGTTRAGTAAADTNDLSVSAWLAHAEVGWRLASPGEPRLALVFDAASGERPGGRWTRFDPLFGARTFDFGPTSLFGPTTRSNLISPALRFELAPDSRSDVQVQGRRLWLEATRDAYGNTGVRDADGDSGRDVGTQFDARIRRWLVPDRLRLALYGSWLDKGRFLRTAPAAPARDEDALYAAIETTVSF